ncbi:MAG: hypothetical protein AAFZ58_08640 [Pseudomonadota bacterium]
MQTDRIDRNSLSRRTLLRGAVASAALTPCGARAATEPADLIPTARPDLFWGALGCSCFAF